MNLKVRQIVVPEWFIAIILFLVAAFIRALPEIKAGIWPIGYDTFNTYAAELASYHGPLINWLKTANILYFIFLPFEALGMSPNLIVKIFGPVLYGALIISFYVFARKFLKFSQVKSFLLVFLTIFQFAALRISWDLYRNELALIFLFLGLIYLPEIQRPKNLILFSIFATLVTLSNQLVTVLLLIILLVYGVYYLIKHQWKKLISLAIPLMIVAACFAMVISSSGQVLYDPHVFFTSGKNYFWRYFYHYNLDMPYTLLKQQVESLFWLLYSWWFLFFALIGFWRLRQNLVLISLTVWLLFGTFSSLVFFGNGLMVWERWMFMLVFPLTIYATEGFFFLGSFLGGWRNFAYKLPKLAFLLAGIFWLIIIGFFISQAIPFLTRDYQEAQPPLANEELNIYFPRTMVHNSVGIDLADDTVKAIEWLSQRAPSGSLILVDNRYRGIMITHFDIDDRYIITNPWSETIQSPTLEAAKKMDYWPIYLIWNISRSIPGFDRINNFGDRGIYQALPEFREQ